MEREIGWLTRGLRDLGHNVVILCKMGSSIEGSIGGNNEQEFAELVRNLDFDVIIDFSHDKVVSQTYPDKPQINTYQVMTVGWKRNPVFISKAQRHFVGMDQAPVIYYGLDIDEYPFYDGPREDYLLYMGSILPEKRVQFVPELGRRLGLPVKLAGPCWDPDYFDIFDQMKEMPHVEWVGDVGGQEKLELLQKARCLVHPVGMGPGKEWVEAGAIIVLESLMVGTPVIASTNGCLPEYVVDFNNGFICATVDEMITVAKYLPKIDPYACRLSVVDKFNKERFAREYEALAMEVIEGKEW
jgi:glycosyltransferase involved in cell wall biosynthesis